MSDDQHASLTQEPPRLHHVTGSREDRDFQRIIRESGGRCCLMLTDEASGLKAVLAIDSLALGPAAGGIRTRRYASIEKGVAEAVRLAEAMTLKCAVAGLRAGGAKMVVFEHEGLQRRAAFKRIGALIEDLNGLYRAAGDLGTSADDLHAAAQVTRYINRDTEGLAHAAALGVLNCMEGCARMRGRDGVRGLRIAVQGCGAMGAGVARLLAEAGAQIAVADSERARSEALAAELKCTVADHRGILTGPFDIVAPCAIGAVLTPECAERMQAWAVCGVANNQLSEVGAERMLQARAILYVPDFIASAGAVIRGLSDDQEAKRLIARLSRVTRTVLRLSEATGAPTSEVGMAMAQRRIARASNLAAPALGIAHALVASGAGQ